MYDTFNDRTQIAMTKTAGNILLLKLSSNDFICRRIGNIVRVL